jgi:cell division protein FtsL
VYENVPGSGSFRELKHFEFFWKGSKTFGEQTKMFVHVMTHIVIIMQVKMILCARDLILRVTQPQTLPLQKRILKKELDCSQI